MQDLKIKVHSLCLVSPGFSLENKDTPSPESTKKEREIVGQSFGVGIGKPGVPSLRGPRKSTEGLPSF